jgi:nucleoside-diphosphate-sugar epimerase
MSTPSTRPAKVAVIGATGQVGSALVHRFHGEGVKVVAVVRNALGAALIDAWTPGCDIRIGSPSREPGRPHLLEDCDVIINCALASGEGDPRQTYVSNRALVDGLLQAPSLRWLIHFSTVAVYRELIQPSRDAERTFRHPAPNSEYGRSKLDVERYALRHARARGLRGTILRLGHVYGAGIARSREIVTFARDPHFHLPYGGRFPSNAIHVDRLTSAVLALFGRENPGEVYNLAEPTSTWRDVFDWHSGCLGLTPVEAMSEAASDAGRDHYARRSVAREMAAWVRALPLTQLVKSPAVLDLALRILAKMPAAVTKRVGDTNRRVAGHGQVARLLGGRTDPLHPIYYSAGMPGAFLPIPPDPPAGVGSNAARSRELREWVQRWSTPRLLRQGRREHAVPEVMEAACVRAWRSNGF